MHIDLAYVHEGESERESFEDRLRPLLLPGYRVAYAMLQDREAAEDALQEASIRAWRRLGNLRPGSEMAPWFLGIVVNQCRTLRRQRWWSVLRVDRLPTSDAAPADLDGDEALRRAVGALPVEQRAVVLLHYFADLPIEEVAIAVGAPLGTVKSRLHRARERLRPLLESEDDE